MGILLTQVSINNAETLTFQQLGNLIINNKIAAGKVYRVSNWKSTYMEWNGSTYNLVQVSDYNLWSTDFSINDPLTGLPYDSEPLYFIGLSGNRLQSQVYSELFPYDELYFEFDFTGPGNTVNMSKSRITLRHDLEKGIKTYYDWRWIQFPRFKFEITHIVTHTIAEDFTLYPILRDVTDYTGFTYDQNILTNHFDATFTVGVNLPSSNNEKTIEINSTYLSDYIHVKTFGTYNAVGFENILINKKSNALSVFNLIGNNIVFYKGLNISGGITLLDCEDLTFINDNNNITLDAAQWSIFNNTKNLNGNITNSSIKNANGLTGTIDKFYISQDANIELLNNKFNIDTFLIHDWTDKSTLIEINNNDIKLIKESYIGNASSVPIVTTFSFNYNTGLNLINTHMWCDSSINFNYEVIVSEMLTPEVLTWLPYTSTWTNYNTFNYNTFTSIETTSITSHFFGNTIKVLNSCVCTEPFFENRIYDQLSNINFGNKIIFRKIKDAEKSTFEKIISIDLIINQDPLLPYTPDNINYWANSAIGPYGLLLDTDDLQYIGIFIFEYPYSYYTSNGNQTTLYVDSINHLTLPCHRIQFKIKENNDFNWFLVFRNTEAANTTLSNNIMLANTTILPLSETNRDWVTFQADGINTGTVLLPQVTYVWQQYDAQTYNTFGNNSWIITPSSVTPSGGCCAAIEIPYNNSIYTNVQAGLDAALFVPINTTDVSISNVQVISGNGNGLNLTPTREWGERIEAFKLNWTTNKKMSSILEFQILVQLNNNTIWSPMVIINATGTGVGFQQNVVISTTAPFNNANATNFYITVANTLLTTTPITSTSKIKLKIKTTDINPLTGLNEEVETITSIDFFYPFYYGMTDIPISISTITTPNPTKELIFLNQPISVQPPIPITSFYINATTSNYVFFALHSDLLQTNFITDTVNPLLNTSLNVYLPDVSVYGIKDDLWITYLITRPNPWSGQSEKYILFRSQYKSSGLIPINIVGSMNTYTTVSLSPTDPILIKIKNL